MKPSLLCAIPCVFLATHAHAASELVIKDIHLTTELLPADFDFDNSSTLSSNSGSDEYESSFGFSAGAIYSWSLPGASSGWLAGGELGMRQQSVGSSSDQTSFGLRGIAGYAYSYNDRFTFSVEPFIGLGLTDMTITNSEHINGFDLDGTYFEYGIKLKSIISINEQWKGIVGLGYINFESSLDGGPDDFETELQTTGVYASVGFSWRWNSAPWTLE